MNGMNIFTYNSTTVRALEIDGAPWFVGKDVAEALAYTNPQKAVRDHVDNEDKGVNKTFTPGGEQKTIIINESGMYSLIFGSKLESARRFKRWVTSEVLPALRRTGSYTAKARSDPAFARAAVLSALAKSLAEVRKLYESGLLRADPGTKAIADLTETENIPNVPPETISGKEQNR